MATVRGRPFLEHLMDYWIGQGIRTFILSVGYRHDVITEYFGQQYRGVPLVYSIEQEPLGTGGGVLQAARALSDPFVLLNGDTFFAVELDALLRFHTDSRSEVTFSVFRTRDTGRYMCMNVTRDGKVLELVSKVASVPVANGGVYVIDAQALSRIPYEAGTRASLEGELLPVMLDAGAAFYALESSGVFIDIGIPSDYYRAGRVLPE